MNFNIVWFNLDYYTPLQLILFAAGALLWIVAYIVIVRNIIKHKFVEMPAAVLCANFAWEFIWTWVFQNNMGFAIQLGYYGWFFLDVFIIWGFYKYGYKQVNQSAIPYYRYLFTFGIIGWTVILYFFIKQGIDNPIGANSAYVINILISSLYVVMFLRLEDKSQLSFTAAWTKWLGTGLISVMCAMRWPENYWMISMCTVCFLLDMFYMYLILEYRKQLKESVTVKYSH